MKLLTVFSAFMLPLTFVTSFYWMNVKLPYADSINFVYFLLVTGLFIMVLFYLLLRRSWKF
jgi:Mg2+ and Co2+ transporter CorA